MSPKAAAVSKNAVRAWLCEPPGHQAHGFGCRYRESEETAMSECKACGGSGVCGECYGSGKRYDGQPCNYCKGTKNCRTCGGSGKG